MLKITLLFLTFLFAQSLITQSAFREIINHALPEGVKMIPIDLGRSLHGYTIMAYGITAIPQMPDHPDPHSLTFFPASLITSYFHPRDEHTPELCALSAQFLLSKYSTDMYTYLMLSRSIVWMIPFVNVDAYESFLKDNITSQQQRAQYVKNWNKNPDPYGHLNDQCSEPHTQGINIDNNFWEQYSNKQDICEEFFGGFDIFSEPEAQALKKFISNFNIRVIIDLQAYGDFWVYPNHIYDQIKANRNKNDAKLISNNARIYEDLISKIRHGGFKIGAIHELRNKIKGGGFIQWASKVTSEAKPNSHSPLIQERNGIIALTCMFGKQFILSHEELEGSANKAMQIINMLLIKNSALFERYVNGEKNKVYIQGVGTIPFLLEVKIENLEEKEVIQTKYQVRVGDLIEIDLPQKTKDKTTGNVDFLIHFNIFGTGIQEHVNINEMKIYQNIRLEIQEIVQISVNEQQGFEDGFFLRLCKFLAVLILVLAIFRCKIREGGIKKKGYDHLNEGNKSI